MPASSYTYARYGGSGWTQTIYSALMRRRLFTSPSLPQNWRGWPASNPLHPALEAGQFFVGLRVNTILNVRTVDFDENNLPTALDCDLDMWSGWNVFKFYRRRCGSGSLTFLSCS